MRIWPAIAAIITTALFFLPVAAHAAPAAPEPVLSGLPIHPALAMAFAGLAALVASRGPSV
ncbi:MAG: hypothetical protein AAFR65_00615 [Pseudomonadota bacterium]